MFVENQFFIEKAIQFEENKKDSGDFYTMLCNNSIFVTENATSRPDLPSDLLATDRAIYV